MGTLQWQQRLGFTISIPPNKLKMRKLQRNKIVKQDVFGAADFYHLLFWGYG